MRHKCELCPWVVWIKELQEPECSYVNGCVLDKQAENERKAFAVDDLVHRHKEK